MNYDFFLLSIPKAKAPILIPYITYHYFSKNKITCFGSSTLKYSNASKVTTHGDIVVAKFFALKGPSYQNLYYFLIITQF
jgi:hypothetical protein